MTITVKIKNVFGVDKIYPVCDGAKTLAKIAGTKTLTRAAVVLAGEMGITVQLQQQAIGGAA